MPTDGPFPHTVFVLGSYMQASFLHVDRLPASGESLAATGRRTEDGGKGLNLAVGLHRLGADVRLLLAVGADLPGAAVRSTLVAEGIAVDRVLALGDRSGYGVGFVAADGSNFLVTDAGANGLLTADVIGAHRSAFTGCRWACAQFEVPTAAVAAAFTIARSHGARTCLNPSPWRPLPTGLLDLTDVLVVNQAEAVALFDTALPAGWAPSAWQRGLPALARGIGWHGELLVVTLADQGSVALAGDGDVVHQPAFAVDQVDATGAGDAFTGGLLAGWMDGLPLDQALRRGNAAGAMVAATSGVLRALPREADMTAWLAEDRPLRPVRSVTAD